MLKRERGPWYNKLISTISGVDPHSIGWKRHPRIPRCWITADGQLFKFAVDQPETVTVPTTDLRDAVYLGSIKAKS